MIVDTLSHEYGYTLDQILKMTRKEVSWRMSAINDRQDSEKKFTAVLHDKELKMPDKIKVRKSTEAEKKLINKNFQEKFKRK